MPFQKGHRLSVGKGRPPKGSCLTDLLKEVAGEKSPISKHTKLQMIANTVVDLATKGEQWAVQLVFERLEGKVKDTLELQDNRPVIRIESNALPAAIQEDQAQIVGAVKSLGSGDDPVN